MSRRVAHDIIDSIVLAGILALASCVPRPTATTTSENPPPRLGERAEEGQYAEPPLPASPGPTVPESDWRITPPLPAPIETITNDQLFRYLDGLVYDQLRTNRHKVHRKCTGCLAGRETIVLLQPEWGAHEVRTGDIDHRGVVIGRFINFGADEEDRYKIPAGRRAWWLVSRPSRGAPLRTRVITRTYSQTGVAVHTVTDAAFRGCPQPGHPRTPVARAKWRECTDPIVESDSLNLVLRRSFLPVRSPSSHNESTAVAWVTCDLGCCVGG